MLSISAPATLAPAATCSASAELLPRSRGLPFNIKICFSGKNYDSIYTKEITEGQYYNFFIWETSSGIKKEILYYVGTLPGELDSLDRYLNKLFVSQRKVKTERFNVNPLVIEMQSRLFKKFPPPPISVDSVAEENTDSNH